MYFYVNLNNTKGVSSMSNSNLYGKAESWRMQSEEWRVSDWEWRMKGGGLYHKFVYECNHIPLVTES